MSIELRKVSKKFGEVNAVQNVSFSVKEGELIALLGPSGGGKTTVLRMIDCSAVRRGACAAASMRSERSGPCTTMMIEIAAHH